MSDPSAATWMGLWAQGARASAAAMTGPANCAYLLARLFHEGSYEEAPISRVNKIDVDVPAGAGNYLACSDLTEIGPGAPLKTITKSRCRFSQSRDPAPPQLNVDRRTLTVTPPAGSRTGDYVTTIQDTRSQPPKELGRWVVFVLAPKA